MRMKPGWRSEPFDAVIADESGGNAKTLQSEFLPVGRYAVVDQGKELIAGYVDDEARLCHAKLPAIVFGDHTRCFKYVDFPFCMGADGIKVLRPKINADVKYLYHYLRQLRLTEGGYDRHFKYLKRSSVVLPPLPEQRRIGEILDKADALRAKRRAALAQLDTLTKSIFLDMFGDPAMNPKGWLVSALGELAAKVTDGEHLNPEFSPSGMPIVMAGDVLDDGIDLEKARMVEWDLGVRFRRKCDPEAGDLLLVSRGATIGRQCVVRTDHLFCLMGSVILIKPRGERVEPSFLSAYLKHPVARAALYKTSGSSAQQAIYLKDLRNLRCIVPPIDLQRNFTRCSAAVAAVKTDGLASIEELDALFFSLQHRAFRGEL